MTLKQSIDPGIRCVFFVVVAHGLTRSVACFSMHFFVQNGHLLSAAVELSPYAKAVQGQVLRIDFLTGV